MSDMSFDDAIDKFRHGFIHRDISQEEYDEALDYITYHWDYDRAREINHAIAPIGVRPLTEEEPDHVYILMSVKTQTYCVLHRNKQALWI